MGWLFEGKDFVPPEKAYGFIYCITNTVNGKKYIGRKYLTKAGYKTVKGKRKKLRKTSDWETYHGSSPQLLKDIEIFGKDNFTREILKICYSRGECNYWEAALIVEHNALLSDDYYNQWLQVKVSRLHIKNI